MSDGGEWGACPPGELNQLALRLRRARQFRVLRQASSVAVVLLVAVGGITWYANPPQSPVEKVSPVITPVTRVTCGDVHREMEALLAGNISEERAAAIQRHLDRCPPCQHFANDWKAEHGVSCDESGTRVEVVSLNDWGPALAFGHTQP